MTDGCGGSEPFALRVLGDSMAPEFPEGSIIIVDPAGVIEDGCHVIAEHEGTYIFRRLRIDDRRHVLEALEPGHERIEIDGVNAIVGVIVQRAGTRRREHKHYVKMGSSE